jgi:hypothetical protein
MSTSRNAEQIGVRANSMSNVINIYTVGWMDYRGFK